MCWPNCLHDGKKNFIRFVNQSNKWWREEQSRKAHTALKQISKSVICVCVWNLTIGCDFSSVTTSLVMLAQQILLSNRKIISHRTSQLFFCRYEKKCERLHNLLWNFLLLDFVFMEWKLSSQLESRYLSLKSPYSIYLLDTTKINYSLLTFSHFSSSIFFSRIFDDYVTSTLFLDHSSAVVLFWLVIDLLFFNLFQSTECLRLWWKFSFCAQIANYFWIDRRKNSISLY